MQIMDGTWIECSNIKELDQNGLGGYSLYVEFAWKEEPDIWMPDMIWCVRKPGKKRKMKIGTHYAGFPKLAQLPPESREVFLRYVADLEEKKMDAIGKIVEKEWAAEQKADECGYST